MTNTFDNQLTQSRSLVNGLRALLGASGLVSLVVGLVILIWPVKTAVVVAGIIAVYAIIAGLVNLAIGIFSRRVGGWARFAYLALGAVFVVAAILAFANLGAAAAGLAILVSVVIGIVWIIEGVVGLTMVGGSTSKVWTILYAVLSVIAGIVMVTSPLWGASVLWLLFGISLLLLGIIQIIRAFRFGSVSA